MINIKEIGYFIDKNLGIYDKILVLYFFYIYFAPTSCQESLERFPRSIALRTYVRTNVRTDKGDIIEPVASLVQYFEEVVN